MASMSSSPNQQKGKEGAEQADSVIKSHGPDVTYHTSIHIPFVTVSHVVTPGWKRGLVNVALASGTPPCARESMGLGEQLATSATSGPISGPCQPYEILLGFSPFSK